MTEAAAGGLVFSLLLGFVGLIIAIALIAAIFEIRTLLHKILIVLWANVPNQPAGPQFNRLRQAAPTWTPSQKKS